MKNLTEKEMMEINGGGEYKQILWINPEPPEPQDCNSERDGHYIETVPLVDPQPPTTISVSLFYPLTPVGRITCASSGGTTRCHFNL